MARNPFPLLRVWPEYASSGIWAPPDPLGLHVGQMVDYEDLELPKNLVARFSDWQRRYDFEVDPHSPDEELTPEWWSVFVGEQISLARALFLEIGGRIQWEAKGYIWTVGQCVPDVDHAPSQQGYQVFLSRIAQAYQQVPLEEGMVEIERICTEVRAKHGS